MFDNFSLFHQEKESFLHRKPDEDATFNVIELGSGCGIAGISLVQRLPNCRVLLTDLEEADTVLFMSKDLARPAKGSTIQHRVLNWDSDLPEDVTQTDWNMIVVSDCTYNPDSTPALVKTLYALVRQSSNTMVIVAMKIRHQSESVFFDLMQEAGFGIEQETRIPLYDLAHVHDEEVLIYQFRMQATSSKLDDQVS